MFSNSYVEFQTKYAIKKDHESRLYAGTGSRLWPQAESGGGCRHESWLLGEDNGGDLGF